MEFPATHPLSLQNGWRNCYRSPQIGTAHKPITDTSLVEESSFLFAIAQSQESGHLSSVPRQPEGLKAVRSKWVLSSAWSLMCGCLAAHSASGLPLIGQRWGAAGSFWSGEGSSRVNWILQLLVSGPHFNVILHRDVNNEGQFEFLRLRVLALSLWSNPYFSF